MVLIVDQRTELSFYFKVCLFFRLFIRLFACSFNLFDMDTKGQSRVSASWKCLYNIECQRYEFWLLSVSVTIL